MSKLQQDENSLNSPKQKLKNSDRQEESIPADFYILSSLGCFNFTLNNSNQINKSSAYVVVSKICYFYPYLGGNDSIWPAYVSVGLGINHQHLQLLECFNFRPRRIVVIWSAWVIPRHAPWKSFCWMCHRSSQLWMPRKCEGRLQRRWRPNEVFGLVGFWGDDDVIQCFVFFSVGRWLQRPWIQYLLCCQLGTLATQLFAHTVSWSPISQVAASVLDQIKR